MIHLTGRELQDLDEALTREWLETNGLGGYASSTILGANTRRYHGLLVAHSGSPGKRFLFLSKVEEEVYLGGDRYPLSCNLFPGKLFPEGHRYLAEFSLTPFPTFRYLIGPVTIAKTVFMPHGRNSTAIIYENLSGVGLTLKVSLLVALREHHDLSVQSPQLQPVTMVGHGVVALTWPLGQRTLYLHHNSGHYSGTGDWYRQFRYPREEERGLPCHEDLYCPGSLTFSMAAGGQVTIVATVDEGDPGNPWLLLREERERRERLAEGAGAGAVLQALARAADCFIISRQGQGSAVIAGYPWFTEWGRDTMVALPGLYLTTGRAAEARSVLTFYASQVADGTIPNRFPEGGGPPDYAAADAPLWFIYATERYVTETGDLALLREGLYPVLKGIVDSYCRGTRYGVGMSGEGLIELRGEGPPLTWMDTRFTVRRGKPVEINALWFNALKSMEGFARALGLGSDLRRFRGQAALTKKSFNRLFWNEGSGCLYDLIGAGAPDRAVRPNQLLAVGLPYSPLPRWRRREILKAVRGRLLTPYGLRSLDPDDPRYVGRYEGGEGDRERAYHQGTVWPWLLGPFLTGYLQLRRGSRKAKRHVRKDLAPLLEHLSRGGLGQVSEVFDGDPPHTARGCIAQAWSVAEVLRAYAAAAPGK